MNAMKLINALGFIDDDLLFDAMEAPQQGTVKGGSGIRQPKPNKPNRGGAKVKAIVIGVVALICAAAIVIGVLFATGVFGKQKPVYTGMEISSTTSATASADSSATALSSRFGGDYKGKNDDVDKNNPYGGSGSLDSAVSSTLQVTGAGEDIYYADAGSTIYITIKFDNPDSYEILSFVINGEKYTSYMFVTGSDLENIIISVNVGTTPGIKDYTISEIKYVDGTEIKDVTMRGETVVSCGVRTSDMVTATASNETTDLTSISFNVTLTDAYSLLSYSSDYYAKALLYDGETILQTVDLSSGTNNVTFTNLTPNTLYQYAVVGYYDDFSGSGASLNYLYTSAVYTDAVVLFDEVTVGQEGITFAYSWYEGYSAATITRLTLTSAAGTQTLAASDLNITGLLSNTEYTLTAYYAGTNGTTESITLEFTTEAKAVPAVEIEVTDATVSTLTFTVDYIDTDNVGEITAIGLYDGDTLVKSETNFAAGEYTYEGLSSYTEYTLKVSYSYDLNDGNGVIETEESLSEYTDPLVELESLTFMNNSTISENDTIVLQASMNNPDSVTFTSVVINGETYAASALGTKTSLVIEIVYSDQFAGGTTELTVTQVNCIIGGNSYSVAVSANNTASVFIYGELTVEEFSVVRYNGTSNEYEQTDYGLASEQLYYRISLSNATGYSINTITIDSTVYRASDMTISSDYQTVIIKAKDNNSNIQSHTLSYIEYSYNTSNFFRSDDVSVFYVRLSSDEVVEISSADDLKNMTAEYKYYKLMNDIDLSGYAWVNINNYMYGVFDGNGHTIKNIGAVATYNNTSLNIGLFTYAQGIVKDLTISNMLYIVTLNNTIDATYDIYAGGVAAIGEYMFISDVDISMSVKVINTNKLQYVGMGGLLGNANSVYKTDNVSVEAVLACDIGQTECVYIGGLYGIEYAYGGKPITNVTVDLTVDIAELGNNYCIIGGLIGCIALYNGFTISDVTVNTDVTYSSDYVHILVLGGIVGQASNNSTLSFYEVDSEMTVNVSYDSIYALDYNTFVTGINPYIDESCTGTITVNET